jgi:hypothetical protein
VTAPRIPVIADNQSNWNRTAAGALTRAQSAAKTNSDNIAANTAAIAAINAAIPHTAPVTVTADAIVGATDRWIINNKSGSTCTLTLPAAASFTGRQIGVKTIQAQTVVSATSNVVPLAGGAAGTAILAATAGKWATLVSDGTSWVMMAGA